MRKKLILLGLACISTLFFLSQCGERKSEDQSTQSRSPASQSNFGGYDSPELWGEHLVTIGACHDCHTPKKMTPQGPDIDSSLLLSGHPAQLPDIDVNRKEMESKGLVTTGDLTSWVGPWGISYTANLTSDATGIGNWNEGQFIYAIRNGKMKGAPQGRNILPPMPWQMYKSMTDDELKAIFAYLKSTKPIKNVVPPPKPPVSASH